MRLRLILCGSIAVLLLLGAAALSDVHSSSQSAYARTVPTPTVVPTGTPSPTPTATMPAPAKLLAQANGAISAEGSLFEHGVFRSSDAHVIAGFTFSAEMSWHSRAFRDNHRFFTPQYVKSYGGYVTDIRRVAGQKALAEDFNGNWTCAIDPSPAANELWQPPSFSFPAPRLVGSVRVRGLHAWDIQGVWSHNHAGQHTALTIDVYIDQSRDLYLKSKQSGVVTLASGRQAHVSGEVDYFHYGQKVVARVPAACGHAGKHVAV